MLGRIIVYPKTIPISLASIIQQPVPPLTLAERAALFASLHTPYLQSISGPGSLFPEKPRIDSVISGI